MLDHSAIQPYLFQGSKPLLGRELVQRGFAAVVLCAAELQFTAEELPGVEILRCPLDDTLDPIPRATWESVLHTAERVARRVRARRPVIITCAAGKNRSGLVTAATLHCLTGLDGASCVRRVQLCRPGALFNGRFVQELTARLPLRRSA